MQLLSDIECFWCWTLHIWVKNEAQYHYKKRASTNNYTTIKELYIIPNFQFKMCVICFLYHLFVYNFHLSVTEGHFCKWPPVTNKSSRNDLPAFGFVQNLVCFSFISTQTKHYWLVIDFHSGPFKTITVLSTDRDSAGHRSSTSFFAKSGQVV